MQQGTFGTANGRFTRIGIGTQGQVLTVSSTLLPTWQTFLLANWSVTLANLRAIQTGRLLGRNSAGSGTVEELNRRQLLTRAVAAIAPEFSSEFSLRSGYAHGGTCRVVRV